MHLDDDIFLFIEQLDNQPIDLIRYAKVCNELLYLPINAINLVCDKLSNNIIKSCESSRIYSTLGIKDKKDLSNKEAWYNRQYDSFENHTSGTTTGRCFKYLIWKDIYHLIESDCHYQLILNEFGLSKDIKILYMHQETIDFETTELIKIDRSNNPLLSHGAGKKAEIHTIIINKTYLKNIYRYYEEIIDYIIGQKIDVIHSKSNVISSLCWNINRLNVKDKICKLISNTGSKLNSFEVSILKQKGIIENWCDHMRCWDGGASFFSCRHNTYHLMDNLAWTYSDNQRLVSIDYFSLPSPFVHYWNGDYSIIESEYQRCKCGRAYRPFRMGRTRSENTNYITDSASIQDKMLKNGLLDDIIRIECVSKYMRVFSKKSLDIDKRKAIANLFTNNHLLFTVEDPYL